MSTQAEFEARAADAIDVTMADEPTPLICKRTASMDDDFVEHLRAGVDPKEICAELEAIANRYDMSIADFCSIKLAACMLLRLPRQGWIVKEG